MVTEERNAYPVSVSCQRRNNLRFAMKLINGILKKKKKSYSNFATESLN